MYHIDYGFILGISPGGNLGFETAIFKLTPEMIELLGGTHSETFMTFVQTTIRGFLVARRLMRPIISIVASFADSGLPCFNYTEDNIARMLDRFMPGKWWVCCCCCCFLLSFLYQNLPFIFVCFDVIVNSLISSTGHAYYINTLLLSFSFIGRIYII